MDCLGNDLIPRLCHHGLPNGTYENQDREMRIRRWQLACTLRCIQYGRNQSVMQVPPSMNIVSKLKYRTSSTMYSLQPSIQHRFHGVKRPFARDRGSVSKRDIRLDCLQQRMQPSTLRQRGIDARLRRDISMLASMIAECSADNTRSRLGRRIRASPDCRA